MFAKNAWIGFTKCRLLLMRIEEERMDAIRFQKNTFTEKIESIDYTHLLGYPSEVVAAEVITLVKEVVSDHMDKVVEQLKKTSYWTEPTYDEDGYSCDDEIEVIDLSDAIEIVKGGYEEVYREEYDTAGNYHAYGTQSGHCVVMKPVIK